MSTIAAQTISNLAGTSSTSTDNVVNGCAKAWVNFNGTGTVAIRASFNVSSITDLGVGYYGINFTNAMSDANYSAVATGGLGNWGSIIHTGTDDNSWKTTTQCQLYASQNAASARTDCEVSVAIFR